MAPAYEQLYFAGLYDVALTEAEVGLLHSAVTMSNTEQATDAQKNLLPVEDLRPFAAPAPAPDAAISIEGGF